MDEVMAKIQNNQNHVNQDKVVPPSAQDVQSTAAAWSLATKETGFKRPLVELSSNFEVRNANIAKHQQRFKQAWRFDVVRSTAPVLNAQEKNIIDIRKFWAGALPVEGARSAVRIISEEQDHSFPTGDGGGGDNPWEKLAALLNSQGSQKSLSPSDSLAKAMLKHIFHIFRAKSAQRKQDGEGDDVGGINLSDEHLTLNVKVDGQGMPIADPYQIKAMQNLNGLTSIIRKISP